MTPILIRVGGTPRAQQRPRFMRGRVVSTPDKKLQLWKSMIERACRAAIKDHGAQPLFRGAVRVDMRFTFPPPASDPARSGPHTQKPDKDNLEKAALDAMEAAGLFANDCQVAAGKTEKRWGYEQGMIAMIAQAEPSEPAAPAFGNDAPDWLA